MFSEGLDIVGFYSLEDAVDQRLHAKTLSAFVNPMTDRPTVALISFDEAGTLVTFVPPSVLWSP